MEDSSKKILTSFWNVEVMFICQLGEPFPSPSFPFLVLLPLSLYIYIDQNVDTLLPSFAFFYSHMCTFTCLTISVVIWLVFFSPCISPYFGLSDTFPWDQLLVRTYTGKKRNIYLASRLVKELTRRNESVLKVCSLIIVWVINARPMCEGYCSQFVCRQSSASV